jgi:hypothetical protein
MKSKKKDRRKTPGGESSGCDRAHQTPQVMLVLAIFKLI